MTDLPPRRNIKLVIAYDGTRYHGWQRQAEGIDTVQQRLEEALVRVCRHPLVVFGAGRTDAGVHAAGQVANFYTPNFAIPLSGLRRAVNARLPGDVAIVSATEVPANFHASRSAIGKTYQYRIATHPRRPIGRASGVWHYWRPLDADRMAAAAGRLVGTFDFVGFATSSDERTDTIRTVSRCDVASRTGTDEILVTVEGGGFLYNMVRNIVGTLVEIGRGRWEPAQIDRILASRDRRDAGPTAPPGGLSLMCVHYRPADVRPPTPLPDTCDGAPQDNATP